MATPYLLMLLVGGVAALAAVVIAMQRTADRRRADQMREVAPALGLSFEGESKKPGESGFDPVLTSFALLKRGRSSRVRYLMRAATVDGEELLFEFRYVVSTGNHSQAVVQTVAAFRRRGARIPAFRLSPESIFSKIGHFLGGQDIDFDSNEAFSSQYVLKGEDPDAVRAFFAREAVMYFADRPGWSAEGAGEWLILYRASRREKPEDLREWLDQVRRAARALDSR